MNCERYRELLPARYDGDMPQEDVAALEAHDATCEACREYGADYATFEGLLGSIAADDLGEEPPALDVMLRAIGAPAAPEAAPAGRVVPLHSRRFAWVAAAAAVLIAVAAWQLIPRDATADRIEARLYANQTVGRVTPNATIRIFKNDTSKVFHDLGMLQMPGSRSLNNLTLRERQVDRVVRSDADGRIEIPGGLREPRLALIEKPGHLAAWGIVEPLAGERAPDRDVALYPARTVRVTGRLVDASTKKPVPDAFVATIDGSGVARTDAEGRFGGTFQFAEKGDARLRAQANGYGDSTVAVTDGADRFEWETDLPQVLRQTADVTVLDGDGRPVAGAVAIAIPAPRSDAERDRIPVELRTRPEVAVSDASGKLGLRALYDCPYRLEFLHGRSRADGDLFFPNQAKTVRLRPDGDSHILVRTHRNEAPVPTRVVLASRAPDGVGATGFLEGSTDAKGLVSFASLDDGPGSLRIYSRDGHQFTVEFTMTPATQVQCEYEMPPCTKPLAGTVVGPDRIVALRLEGTLAPIAIGGTLSTAHTLAIETPVAEDGSFRFPPLPAMSAATLSGRLRADPLGERVPLRATPPLDPLVAPDGTGGTVRVER